MALFFIRFTHLFDDQGRRFDGNGNLKNWWTNETAKRFEDKAKCIIDQYGNEYVEEAELNLNGEFTQGENIADNGGILEAYYGYGKHRFNNALLFMIVHFINN